MNKRIFLSLVVLLSSVFMFSSCSHIFSKGETSSEQASKQRYVSSGSRYGSYLAGRVAHIRQDYSTAADYYSKTLNLEKDAELTGGMYVLLASERRIPEAAIYARKSIEAGDKNQLTNIIITIDEFTKNRFDKAEIEAAKIGGDVKNLMNAWIKVGQGKKEEAIEIVTTISKSEDIEPLYLFYVGMIYDYFDDTEMADKFYQKMIDEYSAELSFRSIEIIANFYLRNNQKVKSLELVNMFYSDIFVTDLLKSLHSEISLTRPSNAKKIITGANVGLSESLFSIATTIAMTGEKSADLAHIFIALSIYVNPDYDLAKLVFADSLQKKGLYKQANEVYDNIKKKSVVYNVAQLNKSVSFVLQEKYSSAEKILRPLVRDNKKSYKYNLNLADSLRMQKKYNEAVKYYEEAIKNIEKVEAKHWQAFYLLGVSYDGAGDWEDAEQALIKAVALSNNNYIVANHLGYSWIDKGVNVEKAFAMVVSAYNKDPDSGYIMDSLGWSFYKLGLYDEALKYIERASEIEPANPLISEHLGDVYWQVGRKVEAVYLWERSITLENKKPEGDVNISNVENKISNGPDSVVIPTYAKEKIYEIIDTIK